MKARIDYLLKASPYDKIWGIGLNAYHARRTPIEKWWQNWLGIVLMRVRDTLTE